jgi:hypothetical protein
MALLVVSFLHLAFGIAEAVILSRNDARNECGPEIWGCIVMCCVVHFILFMQQTYTNKHSNNNDESIENNKLSYIANSACSIWAMVCYYNTSSECVDHFKDKYSDLWNMLFAEVILFYIGLGVLVIMMVASCFVLKNNSKYVNQQ